MIQQCLSTTDYHLREDDVPKIAEIQDNFQSNRCKKEVNLTTFTKRKREKFPDAMMNLVTNELKTGRICILEQEHAAIETVPKNGVPRGVTLQELYRPSR